MALFNLSYLLFCAVILTLTFLAKHRNGFFYLAALSAWVTSEALSNFFVWPLVSVGYVLFYPLFFVAIPGLFEINQKSELIRLLDGAVLVLGTSTIATAVLLRRIDANFLHILYPICDLILFTAVFICFVRRPVTVRSLLILIGFLVFGATDFLYLMMVSKGTYEMDSIINYGWLLGFTLISTAQYFRGIKSESFPPIPIFYIAISAIASSGLLVAIALQRYEIPSFVIGPAIATLLMAFIRMAVALKRSEKIVAQESLARIDDLTGLPNRRRFISELEKFENGSILLMDLDQFKPVNDKFGHEVGDQILKQVSNRFLKAVPEGSLLARLGGDEFAILTHENYEQAMELAMALRATLSYPFTVSGEQIKIDVSIGCVANDGGSNLMSRADTAMYQAKRGQVGVWAGGT